MIRLANDMQGIWKLTRTQLQLEEVVEILAIDWDGNGRPNFNLEFRLPDPRDILTICSSLISLDGALHNDKDASTQPGVTYVRLAHSSVKNYLMSGRITQSPAAFYALHEKTSNAFIAQCCIVYLLQFTAPPDTALHHAFPLTQYSIRYWTYHFRMSETNKHDNMEDLAIELLTSDQVPYASWCRFYDPDRPWLDAADLAGLDRHVSPLYYMSLLALERLCQRPVEDGANPNEVGGLLWSPLQAAAKQGHCGIVELLLKAGGEADNQKGGGEPALVLAAADGHDTVVQTLLASGADVNIRSTVCATALGYAAQNGHKKTVQFLLKAGADPEQWSRRLQQSIPLVEAASNGYEEIVLQLVPSASQFSIGQALMAAASKGHESIVDTLLRRGIVAKNTPPCAAKAGAQVNVTRHVEPKEPDFKHLRRSIDCSNSTLLSLESAVAGGQDIVVQRLLDTGVKCEPVSLHCTVQHGHIKIAELLLRYCTFQAADLSKALVYVISVGCASTVKLLLDRGAGIESSSPGQLRPLQAAAQAGNLHMSGSLIDQGTNSLSTLGNRLSNSTVIQSAAYWGNPPLLQVLIDRGADIENSGSGLPIALHIAASQGHLLAVELLLDAYEKSGNKDGHESALYSAISANQPDVVTLLLQRGAALNEAIKIKDKKISCFPSPLLHATTNHRLQIVKILLNTGADPNGYSDYGNSPDLPLRIAAAHGDVEIMTVLLDHGANINAQTEDGYSAVHSAARGGHHEALRFLLIERHANPHLALDNGSLALHTAACHGHPKCIEVCLEAGLDINVCNGCGKTVLHWALYRAYHYVGEEGQQATIELLLAKRVDVGIREKETGMLALDYALRSAYDQPENKHYRNMVNLLKQHSSSDLVRATGLVDLKTD